MKPSKRRTQLALILMGIFVASTGASADGPPKKQESPTKDGAMEEAEEDDLETNLERILYMSWGTPLRTRAKQVDGQWQILQGKEWTALRAGSIDHQVPVRDILREARTRERGLKMALADDRADQAMWLIERALYTEALEHLEFCLRKDPDHGPTLTIIDTGLLPMNTPPLGASEETAPEELADALRPWFNSTAFMRRASREIAVRDFIAGVSKIDGDSLRAVLRDELSHRSSGRRELAVLILHRSQLQIEEQTTVENLIKVAILDGTKEVREECARTLRDLQEEALTQPFLRALQSSSPAVRTNAAGALGTLGFMNAAAPLVSAMAATAGTGGSYRPPASHIFVGKQIAYIQDFDVEVAQNSSIAKPNVNVLVEGAVLDVRVLSVRQEALRVHERSAIRGALKGLLGEDFRYDAAKWEKWMTEHPAPE